ncbi:hypothetical protein [Capnocytophaga canimorsus]|uniref:Uncharacterized protein n=1 Tax=Capnocytophaga canimorsus (strain 5) TaxID=860228 RepID=F9YW01_CAPCC|nr:hypothetical protein [Capnocytophaga canimorsus]AEK24504.1 Conserved hypothetical protein [Capnocytophaga canimorsus Cc5]WGU69916.1 hypothetical protein QIU18_10115 [Capnocytophaga canimorsus]VEJ19507.1 Uncharacterised protein [Capnocytophaga canimorsus]
MVAKKADNTDGFELIYKSVNDIQPNEFHVASSIDGKQSQEFLEQTKKYLDKNAIKKQVDKLAKATTDKVDDTVKKTRNIIKNGKFIDDVLEADYQKYLARKAKQNKLPKDRLEWKEARDYWLHDSPMARGNDFNRKAWDERWYPAWEVQLDNGKFMDGYNPFTKEIVSRKATDLSDIQETTFIKYLTELKNKYAPPKKITTKKNGEIYDLIRNKELPADAKLILEIPESNKNFDKIEEYIKIAKEKGMEIRFRPE